MNNRDMNDREMAELIQLTLESSEAREASGPTAKQNCPGMTRLDAMARSACDPTPEEAQHLQECPKCAARLRGLLGEPLPVSRFPTSARHRSTWRSITLSLMAVAAGILLLLIPLLYSPTPDDSTQAIRIAYLPGVIGEDAHRIDRFRLTATRSCVVLPFLRQWQDDCACLEWRLPEGRGIEGQKLERGEQYTIEVDVTGHPPIEQWLVVLTAKQRECLPADADETSEFIQCLKEGIVQEAELPAQSFNMLACLPSEAELLGKSFVVD